MAVFDKEYKEYQERKKERKPLTREEYEERKKATRNAVEQNVVKPLNQSSASLVDAIGGKIQGVKTSLGEKLTKASSPSVDDAISLLQETSETTETTPTATTVAKTPSVETNKTISASDLVKPLTTSPIEFAISTAKSTANDFAKEKQRAQQQLNDIMNKILNREEFSFDLNGDALFQQYKDMAIQQGQLASEDVMGQAAAMTGGYGNSYAQSVGHQAYNQQLDKLNEIVPDLYQLAYEKYNQEGQDLYDKASILMAMEQQEYDRGRDAIDDQWRQKTWDYQLEQDQKAYDAAVARAVNEQNQANREDRNNTISGIEADLAEMSNAPEMEDYINSLEKSGVIDSDEADELYAKYSRKTWSGKSISAASDGTSGYVGDINDNEKVNVGGTVMTLGELYDKLIEDDEMSKTAAKSFIVNLQKKLWPSVYNK